MVYRDNKSINGRFCIECFQAVHLHRYHDAIINANSVVLRLSADEEIENCHNFKQKQSSEQNDRNTLLFTNRPRPAKNTTIFCFHCISQDFSTNKILIQCSHSQLSFSIIIIQKGTIDSDHGLLSVSSIPLRLHNTNR